MYIVYVQLYLGVLVFFHRFYCECGPLLMHVVRTSNFIPTAFPNEFFILFPHIFPGRIMLRRTQADILQGHLPPRTDYVVYCALNNAQREEYERAAAEVKRCGLVIKFAA